MTTPEFLGRANHRLREELLTLRPQLLEASGLIEHHLKDDKSVVTELDLLVEQRLHAAMRELDPSIGFAGEETGADYDQPTFWLVDPIDGTEPFIRGLPFFCSMIALIHAGEPIMSIIYNFTLDEYFHAIKGGGATKNGHPIHVTDRPLGRSSIYFSPYLKDTKLYGITDRVRSRVSSLWAFGAAGYVYTCIATGALDASVIFNGKGKEWDFAPGALLVQEAGGRVANLFSDTYDYRNLEFIASAPGIFPELKQFIESEISAAQ